MAYSFAFIRAWKTKITGYGYIDSWGGDDNIGDGTQEKPFKTMNRALLLTSKGAWICRGYFSEQVSGARSWFSDAYGDVIYDGVNTYTLAYNQIGNISGGFIMTNINASMSLSGGVSCSILINTAGDTNTYYNYVSNYCVVKLKRTALTILFKDSSQSYCTFIDCLTTTRSTTSAPGARKNIYDNCKIYLDAQIATSSLSINSKIDTCLFRSNCTFWARNVANTADVRIDADGQTAAQKFAAIQDWLTNGIIPTATYAKIPWVNCQITDNQIVQCPDGDSDGYDFDFSLIYGDKLTHPACWMDNGKHIGAFPPSIKLAFKNTADLTASPYEIEVKPTDNITINNGRVGFNTGFTGCILETKNIPLPAFTIFNGLNIPFIMANGSDMSLLTPWTDALDLTDSNTGKLTLSTTGQYLELNKVYYVKADIGAYASYSGSQYVNGTIITGLNTTAAVVLGGSGNVFLYPIYKPTVYQGVQVKVWPNDSLPADFATNDAFFPWIDAPAFNMPGDKSMDTGLRCLRVNNSIAGAIDVGTDGKPLTNLHPEYYTAANTSRIHFPILASWVRGRIRVIKIS